ncbi:MAG: cation:proton antiporter subunit C [Candidatus Methanomethyliaceae archaeon]|nr:cation:proton antiporter subunit C [Candidatus Methanomethyliaceae archaeon]MDW7970912.1 cation:proton antiporter subunit C [Nitrososphaerota archaeon]
MIEVTIQLLGFIAAALLLIIGIAGMVFLDNIIKKIIAFTLLSDGVNILLVAIGYIEGGVVPILLPGMSTVEFTTHAALVFPVGIVLTNIVIGVSTTAILVALAIMLYRRYGTLKASVVLKGERR